MSEEKIVIKRIFPISKQDFYLLEPSFLLEGLKVLQLPSLTASSNPVRDQLPSS